jgi:hypothetical protein
VREPMPAMMRIENEFVILSTDEVKENLSIIVEKEIPVRRKKSNGEFSFIPPMEFDTYLKNRNMDFYIDIRIFKDEIENRIQKNTAVKFAVHDDTEEAIDTQETDSVFARELKVAREMSIDERILAVQKNNSRVKKVLEQGMSLDASTMAETGSVIASTLCFNKSSLEENITSPVKDDLLSKLVGETYILIDNLVTLMSKDQTSFKYLADLKNIHTGSGTLDHMNRMLVRFIAFIFFYNGYFSTHSNEVKKYRAYFPTTFFPYYDKIFKGTQNVTLEIAFKNGISPISERKTFIEYAVGSFLHDIGKFPEIAYHDSDQGYDPRKARRHVFDSYNMLLESKKFTWGIVGTGLLHHDYYGASYGYQQSKTFSSKFYDRRIKVRDGIEAVSTKYLLSYNILDVAYENSIAYFPNKVLELLDIYDAMTDSEKKYRKNCFSPEDAIAEIKKEFLDKDNLGVDPILFNIFVDFMKTTGVIMNPLFVEEMKI